MRKWFILGVFGSMLGATVIAIPACNGLTDLESARRRPDARTAPDATISDADTGSGSGHVDAGSGVPSDGGDVPSDAGRYPPDGHHRRW